MTYTWSKYPDAKPNRSGYYYTYYFNNEMNDCFYKAIYYNTSADEWIGWRRGIEPKVIGYVGYEYEVEKHYDEDGHLLLILEMEV